MYKKITSEEVLNYLGDYLQLCLSELEEQYDRKLDDFIAGQYCAFVECLEIISIFWDKANQYGLDFAPEERFPLN